MKIEGLTEIEKSCKEWEEDRYDEVLLYDDIRLIADKTFGSDFVVRRGKGDRWRGLSMHARTQLFRDLKMPEGYLEKCPPGLRQQQYDYWIDKKDDGETRLFRSVGQNGPILGVLPSAFADFPYSDIVKLLSQLEFEIPMKVFSFDRTPTHLRIVIVGSEKMLSLRENSELFPGITVIASDVGACPFTHTDFLFDSYCSNGAVIGKEVGMHVQIKHKGAIYDKAEESLALAATTFPSRLAAVPDAVKRSMKVMIYDGKRAISTLQRNGVAKSLADDVWNEAREEHRQRQELQVRPSAASWWDVASAITRIARTQVPDPIARLKLEQTAGRLLFSRN